MNVWETRLDDKYDCFVERTDKYLGVLNMIEGDVVHIHQQVTLAYGAPFGPDMSDVAQWQAMCIKKADELAAAERRFT